MDNVIVVQISNTFQKLFSNTLYFRQAKFDFFAIDAGQVMVHVLKDQKGGSSELVSLAWFGKDNFFKFDDVGMIHLLE